MKSRRIILTLECQTVYTLAEIRAALIYVALTHGRWITMYPDGETGDGMPNRIVQVQANAIKPEPKPQPVRNAYKFSEGPVEIHGDGVKRGKAKRAKGAK